MMNTYGAAVGLEIHVRLSTTTKLFCADAVDAGAPPNTRVCPVCLGLPGALPRVNADAVKLAVRVALGLNASVQPRSTFARKHCFDADTPKGYQLTQHTQPLATGGSVEVGSAGSARSVRLRHIHLEEDAGRLIHDQLAGATLLDLNRAGVPLVKIVTDAELHSGAEADDFLRTLRQMLEYMGVSSCDMAAGALRVDCNVFVGEAPASGTAPRCEIKNLNSLAAVERAIDAEIARQSAALSEGAPLAASTFFWDAGTEAIYPARDRDTATEYRFLADPDLAPITIEPGWLKQQRHALPEMPAARLARFVEDYGLAEEHARVLTTSRDLADYYENTARGDADPHEAAVWVMGPVLDALRTRCMCGDELPVRPADLVELLTMLRERIVSRPTARRVFARMLATGRTAPQIVGEEGAALAKDAEALHRWASAAVAAHPAEAARLRQGEERLSHFFIDEVLSASEGRANPEEAADAVREALGS